VNVTVVALGELKAGFFLVFLCDDMCFPFIIKEIFNTCHLVPLLWNMVIFYMNLFSNVITVRIYIELRDVLKKNFAHAAYTKIQVLKSSTTFCRPAATVIPT
jgi:hypothetical protein